VGRATRAIAEGRADAAAAPVIAGVRLSHPGRLIYPELGITKQQLAEYYDAIAGWIVPHVRGRPLTLVHCPAGISGPCRYLKHAKAWGPTALRRVNIQEKTKVGEYLVAESTSGVVALAQMGVVEIHTWNTTIDDLERPNRIVWDLDPGPRISWSQTADAARLLRDVLHTLHLRSWVKTTGGRGVHVVVPLRPSLDWSECLAFSRAVAEALERSDSRRFTTAFSKAGRERKILVDYLRNNRTNTSVSAYSPRARPGAPVSTPITWNELKHEPGKWTLPSVARRLERLREDPWAEYWKTSQRIAQDSMAALEALNPRLSRSAL
jgi:bifunctional non-homologous end joining protein LigD